MQWVVEPKSKIDYWTYINEETLTGAYVTKNTYSGRTFSSSVWLVFNVLLSDWVKASIVVPYRSFQQKIGVEMRFFVGQTLYEADVKYVSDTSYQAKLIGTLPDGSENVKISCFGINLES